MESTLNKKTLGVCALFAINFSAVADDIPRLAELERSAGDTPLGTVLSVDNGLQLTGGSEKDKVKLTLAPKASPNFSLNAFCTAKK